MVIRIAVWGATNKYCLARLAEGVGLFFGAVLCAPRVGIEVCWGGWL